MRVWFTLLLTITLLLSPSSAGAQSVGEVFRRVNPSVVVIRTKEREVAQGQGAATTVSGVGSGILISDDGKVITASHVV